MGIGGFRDTHLGIEASCFEARMAESGDGVSWGSGGALRAPLAGSGDFLALKSDIGWQQFR